MALFGTPGLINTHIITQSITSGEINFVVIIVTTLMSLTTNNDSSDTLHTLETTPSERDKANSVRRFIICILKLFRKCKKTPKDTD